MEVRELAVPGAWEFTPRQYPDDRGLFLEWFRADIVSRTIGHSFEIAQSNQSVSRRGTVRGVHYAEVPPSQAKYVYCPAGAVLDVIVDIRAGSPTFGVVDTVRLDDVDRRALYVSEGLGHAFMALTDDATVTYLCSTGYAPNREHGVNPLDPALNIPWPEDIKPLLSEKDLEAPSLAEAAEQGLLPTYAECLAYYSSLQHPHG
jgi:dTDP-4-dehydrorhamnose 3,5-epimerase